MTREEIQSVIVGLEQAGEGEAVASRKLCRDAVTLLRILSGKHTAAANDLIDTFFAFADLDRERKAVKS